MRALAASVTAIPWRRLSRLDARRWVARALNPTTCRLRFPNLDGMGDAIRDVVDGIDPDVVWAGGIFNAVMVPRGRRMVFSQRDFVHKVRQVRKDVIKLKFTRPDPMTTDQIEQLELDVCRRADGLICASMTDADYLKSHGITGHYAPVVGPTLPRPNFDDVTKNRVFFFGNANTAMRACRVHLKDELWPVFERSGVDFEWHQVGAPPGAQRDDPAWDWMTEHFRVHGFVDDLGDVFQPGDVSLVPYKHQTGFRTKFTVAAGYGVVNVGYDESFGCAPEFTPGEDCIAARDPKELVEKMEEFTQDASMRRKLAEGSRQVYEQNYSFEAHLPAIKASLAFA